MSMYEKDYFIRIIRQLVVILAEIGGLTRNARFREALEKINSAAVKLLGLSSRSIEAMTYKELVHLLTFDGVPDIGKCLALGELLKAEGELFDAKGDPTEAYHRYLKGLNILLEAFKAVEGSDRELYISPIEEIYNKISNYKLPDETQIMMFKYYEKTGRFSKAEDMLFSLVDEYGCREDVIKEGTAFYERLLEKSPEELVSGELPRNEVLEGLASLTKLLE